MSGTNDQDNTPGVAIARQICDAHDGEWLAIFEHLRRERQLSSAVHQMNQLLKHPTHSDLAKQSLEKLGLLH